MEKINKRIVWAVMASESIHIFCCVLPTVFSVLSLLAGAGMIATMPNFIDEAHHLIHDYEIPMIIISALILVFGWGLYAYSRRINCSQDGESSCCHEPCAPKKDRTRLFMIVATVLFFVNVTVYFSFHQDVPVESVSIHTYEETFQNDHQGHDHHGH